MRLLALGLLASCLTNAATVKNETPLRNGCYPDSDQVAMLTKGASITIRSALSGESVPCYKIATEVNGKKVEGYLPGPMIDGLETFDTARRAAAWMDLPQMMSAVKASTTPALSISAGAPIANRATALIEASQPGKALEILEPEIKKRKDPGLLAIAGIAAWRADDSARALELWRASLDIYPNPDLEALYRKVEQENKGDKSGDRLMGMRVQMRYEGLAIPADTARQMLAMLDEEFGRISTELGCTAQERVIAVAQSPQAFRQTTNAAEWSGGQFDGKIRIPVFEGRAVDNQMRRTLAHETTHACLALIGRWPSWLHEGIAQKLSGDSLDPAMQKRLADMAAKGQLPKLDDLAGNWSRMDTTHAQLAYSLSLAAVEVFMRDFASLGLRNLLRSPERLADVTVDLNRRLGL